MKLENSGKLDFVLKPIDSSLEEDILAYQNSVIKVPRCEFRDVFLKVSCHITAAIKDGCRMVGYGALQEAGNNWRISPVHGENMEISEALLGFLVCLGYTFIAHLLQMTLKFDPQKHWTVSQ